MHESEVFLGEVEAFGRTEALARREEARRVLAPGVEAASACAAMPPGPELAAELVRVSALPMDDASRITLTGCWERIRAWADAQAMVALSTAAGAAHPASDRWVASDVALTTHQSERFIEGRLALVRRVGDCLPKAWQALNAGQITSAHLQKLHDATREADTHVAEQVDADLLPKAIQRGWTPSKLRDAARRALLRIDPDGAAERARKARRRSDVTYQADEDDMAALIARGDAWTTRRIIDEVNRRADALRRDGDDRPLGELRLQSLADALLNETPHIEHVQPGSRRPTRRRTPKRAQALVVIDLATLLGLAEHPGHLDGHGPITADLARRIAADSMLRRLVLDPLTGKPVDLGRHAYRLSRAMRRWIDVRDRSCRFPGCTRRAIYCDADHDVEWDRGGETCCDNCGLLCRRHHNFKTSKAWETERLDGDDVRWASPHGFTWTAAAATYDYELAQHDPDPPQDDEPLPDQPPPADDDEAAYDRLESLLIRLWAKAG